MPNGLDFNEGAPSVRHLDLVPEPGPPCDSQCLIKTLAINVFRTHPDVRDHVALDI